MLTKADFKKLIEHRGETCVSIYMPTHPYGPETQEGPIRLKNLVREASNQLEAANWNPPDIEFYLAPIIKLTEQADFWEHQDDGLVIFLSADEMVNYRLPLSFSETVVISNRFHIKPLLPLINSDDRFYVLALSLGSVKLFKGNRYRVSEIEIPELPQGIEEVLKYDDPEQQLQHQTLSNTGGGRPAIHHGHGGDYDAKDNILRYFRVVAGEVENVLNTDQAPLLLAGVDYLLPIYNDASLYPFLVDGGIIGNPEELSPKTIHQRAWEILQPVFHDQYEDAVSIFHQLVSKKPQLVATDLKNIVTAAYFGRIETFFAPIGLQKWGRFRPDETTVEIHAESTLKNEDLLDFAAIHTYLNGGAVYAVKPEKIPGEAEIAGILRY